MERDAFTVQSLIFVIVCSIPLPPSPPPPTLASKEEHSTASLPRFPFPACLHATITEEFQGSPRQGKRAQYWRGGWVGRGEALLPAPLGNWGPLDLKEMS